MTLAAWRGELMQAAAADLRRRHAGGGDGAAGGVSCSWFAAAAPAGEVVLANDNAPGQLVLSGRRPILGELAERISAEGLGRHRLLDVSGPWHGPWMAPARGPVRPARRADPLRSPPVPILLNATGLPSIDPAEIRERVVESLAAPVRWREAMAQLREMEVAAVLEVGPGRVLSRAGQAERQFLRPTTILPVGSLRGVETAAASV